MVGVMKKYSTTYSVALFATILIIAIVDFLTSGNVFIPLIYGMLSLSVLLTIMVEKIPFAFLKKL